MSVDNEKCQLLALFLFWESLLICCWLRNYNRQSVGLKAQGSRRRTEGTTDTFKAKARNEGENITTYKIGAEIA